MLTKSPGLVSCTRLSATVAWAFFGLFSFCAFAGSTDIANEPVVTLGSITTKPNVMFILDDSGSMGSAYMPDDMSDSSTYGYYASQCNGVAYNPNIIYSPPVKADESSYSNRTLDAACNDGFTGSCTTDLRNRLSKTTSTSVAAGTGSKTFDNLWSLSSNTFTVGATIIIWASDASKKLVGTITSWNKDTGKLVVDVTSSSGSGSTKNWIFERGSIYYTYAGSQTALGWKYSSSGSADSSTTFYKECMSAVGNTPGSAVFTTVVVNSDSASSVAENYANWYSYYRKRYLLMRTAVGKAFLPLNSSYRVGFSTISDTGVTDGTNYFRDVKVFDNTQKTNFYSSLYGSSPNSNTPLRAALSKAGRYFAALHSGQTYDPMEYSCQRNFAILSTDGYWNGDGGYKLDGSTMDNQDGTEVRPMYDGSVGTRYRNKYTVSTYNGGGCTSGSSRYRVTIIKQSFNTSTGSWGDVSTTSNSCRSGGYSVNGSTASALAGTTSYDAETITYSGGSSNSLSDVAQYYYNTDLRNATLNNCSSSTSGTTQDVCSDSLMPAGDRDVASWQHMTTYTIGLGVSGTLTYDKNYLTQTAGDYYNIKNGLPSGSPLNWPVPGSGAITIDDLWHAAVNGRGQFYSALNATELSEAISGVVNSVRATTGSASAASTNRLELVAGGSNVGFQGSYTTAVWTGDLKAFSIAADTGVYDTTEKWSAMAKLDNLAVASRNIYFSKSNVLTAFNYSNLNATQKGYFDNLCSKTVVSSQCATLTSGNLALANNGQYLVNYLRGDRTYEASNTSSPLFRSRTHVLGDLVNSAPVYVGPPSFAYTDTDYTDFKTAQASRTPVVYVGANDGMLHAFNATIDTADSGKEMWAFIPSAVMPNLYRLADSSYSTKHIYFVDGTPVVGDVYVGGAWKTILVGGLGYGGRAYYALDITNPAAPSLLWEFTDDNLGLTYGNPVIGKRADGTWIVAFASGYNNTTGDGQGRLYVLDAGTGAILKQISTGVGSSTSPSGLAKINGWIDDASNNTILRYYGGDLFGNLWRFDVDDLVAPNGAALLLAQFKDAGGVAQPITTMPRLKKVQGSYPVVMVGTGRYLGTSDIQDTHVQSAAAVKDPLTDSGWGIIRSNTTFVEQTLTASTSTNKITSTSHTVDWTTKNGWWFDLKPTGGRVSVNPLLLGNRLYVPINVPSGTACTSGGSSWLCSANVANGSCEGEMISDSAMIAGLAPITTSTGTSSALIYTTDGGAPRVSTGVPPPDDDSLVSAGRASWRELSQ